MTLNWHLRRRCFAHIQRTCEIASTMNAFTVPDGYLFKLHECCSLWIYLFYKTHPFSSSSPSPPPQHPRSKQTAQKCVIMAQHRHSNRSWFSIPTIRSRSGSIDRPEIEKEHNTHSTSLLRLSVSPDDFFVTKSNR